MTARNRNSYSPPPSRNAGTTLSEEMQARRYMATYDEARWVPLDHSDFENDPKLVGWAASRGSQWWLFQWVLFLKE